MIRLEQNYRSTQNILDTANEVISHNKGRKSKRLWTANGEGEHVKLRQFTNAFEEAEYISGIINGQVNRGAWKYGDCAILYRTNAQSRIFEEKMLLANIPYKIVGGVNFYARKEIKDILAYLKTIANAEDDLAVRRIINVPKRGIGATTISRVQEYAIAHEASFYNALRVAETIPGIGKSAMKLQNFVQMIQTFRSKEEFYSVKELIEDVIEATGYVKELEAEGTEEAHDRIDDDSAQRERTGIPCCIYGWNGGWDVPELHEHHLRRSSRYRGGAQALLCRYHARHEAALFDGCQTAYGAGRDPLQ